MMNKAGLDRLYLGIETGNDIILKKVTKGATPVSYTHLTLPPIYSV